MSEPPTITLHTKPSLCLSRKFAVAYGALVKFRGCALTPLLGASTFVHLRVTDVPEQDGPCNKEEVHAVEEAVVQRLQ